MSITTKAKKSLLVTVAALTLAGAVAGAAVASGARKSPKPAAHAVEVTTADTDNIQSGDQTTPDAVLSGARTTAVKAGVKAASTTANESGSEAPSSETGGEGTETGGPSDGPGGHEDPPGDVQHEFNGEE